MELNHSFKCRFEGIAGDFPIWFNWMGEFVPRGGIMQYYSPKRHIRYAVKF